MREFIAQMRYFNFSESESKIYLCLLKVKSATGYEISKLSGIARSKIYGILEILVKKGIILVQNSDPVRYCALSKEEFIEKLKRQTSTAIDEIEKSLESVKEEQTDFALYRFSDYQSAMEKIFYLIQHAQKSLFLQIWEEDLNDRLIDYLKRAEKIVNHFIIILFSQNKHYSLPLKKYYCHGFEDIKLKEMNGTWINLIVDDKEVVFGNLQDGKDIIWTKQPAMVLLAKEYVRHDAYTIKIIQENKELFESMGALSHIRDI